MKLPRPFPGEGSAKRWVRMRLCLSVIFVLSFAGSFHRKRSPSLSEGGSTRSTARMRTPAPAARGARSIAGRHRIEKNGYQCGIQSGGRICSVSRGFHGKRRSNVSNSATLRKSLRCGAVLLTGHQNEKNTTLNGWCRSGDPWENRTPVSALRGPCLSRLTNGPSLDC